MITTQIQLFQQLRSLAQGSAPEVAEYAQTVERYAQALAAGQITPEEYQALTQDQDILKNLAATAEQQQQVVQIYNLSRTILSLL